MITTSFHPQPAVAYDSWILKKRMMVNWIRMHGDNAMVCADLCCTWRGRLVLCWPSRRKHWSMLGCSCGQLHCRCIRSHWFSCLSNLNCVVSYMSVRMGKEKHTQQPSAVRRVDRIEVGRGQKVETNIGLQNAVLTKHHTKMRRIHLDIT